MGRLAAQGGCGDPLVNKFLLSRNATGSRVNKTPTIRGAVPLNDGGGRSVENLLLIFPLRFA